MEVHLFHHRWQYLGVSENGLYRYTPQKYRHADGERYREDEGKTLMCVLIDQWIWACPNFGQTHLATTCSQALDFPLESYRPLPPWAEVRRPICSPIHHNNYRFIMFYCICFIKPRGLNSATLMKLHWVCKLIERNEFVQSLNAPEIHSWSSTAFKENSSDELRKVKDCHSLNQWSHGNLKSSDHLWPPPWAWLISATFSMSSTQTSVAGFLCLQRHHGQDTKRAMNFVRCHPRICFPPRDIQRCYQYWVLRVAFPNSHLSVDE